jgi:tetratricopeptide (TPR) repeat protein
VYCCVIYSSMNRADWQRAGQWTEQFTRWCADKGTDGYPGLCRLHRAEVLTVRGHLDEAETEVRAAIAMLARNAPWAEGDAWIALGDLEFSRGNFTAARSAFAKASELGWEAQFGLALLRLAEGEPETAARLLGRINADTGRLGASRRGQSLAWFSIASALAGNVADARQGLAELENVPELSAPPAVQALLERARGEILAAEGKPAGAIPHFRAALRHWQQLDAPLMGAQTRCRLAAMLAADGDPESAALELNGAVAAFTQAGASRLLESCHQLRAALAAAKVTPPARGPTPLRAR